MDIKPKTLVALTILIAFALLFGIPQSLFSSVPLGDFDFVSSSGCNIGEFGEGCLQKYPDLYIGNEQVIFSPLQFVCDVDDAVYEAPSPNINCWSSKILFDGKQTSFIHGNSKKINDYIIVQMIATGKATCENGNCIFRHPEDDTIDWKIAIETEQALDTYYKDVSDTTFNSNKEINFCVYNKLVDGLDLELETKVIRRDFVTEFIKERKKVKRGETCFPIKVNTSFFVQNDYQSHFNLYIGGRIIDTTESKQTSVNILRRVTPKANAEEGKLNASIVSGDESPVTSKEPMNLLLPITALLVFFVVLIIFKFYGGKLK